MKCLKRIGIVLLLVNVAGCEWSTAPEGAGETFEPWPGFPSEAVTLSLQLSQPFLTKSEQLEIRVILKNISDETIQLRISSYPNVPYDWDLLPEPRFVITTPDTQIIHQGPYFPDGFTNALPGLGEELAPGETIVFDHVMALETRNPLLHKINRLNVDHVLIFTGLNFRFGEIEYANSFYGLDPVVLSIR